jgi:hypothetical protein
MALPRFSAETSLYESRVHYRSTGTSLRYDGVVLPQLRFLRPTPPCTPCFNDRTHGCSRFCWFCLPRLGCRGYYLPCDPLACPPR